MDDEKNRPETTLEKLHALEAIVLAQTIVLTKFLRVHPEIQKAIRDYIPAAVEQVEGMTYTDAQIAQLVQSLRMFGGLPPG